MFTKFGVSVRPPVLYQLKKTDKNGDSSLENHCGCVVILFWMHLIERGAKPGCFETSIIHLPTSAAVSE